MNNNNMNAYLILLLLFVFMNYFFSFFSTLSNFIEMQKSTRDRSMFKKVWSSHCCIKF